MPAPLLDHSSRRRRLTDHRVPPHSLPSSAARHLKAHLLIPLPAEDFEIPSDALVDEADNKCPEHERDRNSAEKPILKGLVSREVEDYYVREAEHHGGGVNSSSDQVDTLIVEGKNSAVIIEDEDTQEEENDRTGCR